MPDGEVDLIYVDPPFNTGRTQERRSIRTVRDEDGGDRVGFPGEPLSNGGGGVEGVRGLVSTTT